MVFFAGVLTRRKLMWCFCRGFNKEKVDVVLFAGVLTRRKLMWCFLRGF